MLITEIAKEAKVSPATVSRAINQPEIVAPASLARIRSIKEKHNYVPASVAHRRGPKVGLNQGTAASANIEAFRNHRDTQNLTELITKSVALFDVATNHQARGGALIFRYPDGREERLVLL